MLVLLILFLGGSPLFAGEKVSTRPVEPKIDTSSPDYVAPKTSVDQKCDKVEGADAMNLCRAISPLDTENKNRYQNKDHSYYYCTLIKNKDKQLYCYAVVQEQNNLCGLIIDAGLEGKCNAHFKK